MKEESIIYKLRGDKVIWIIVFLLTLISIAAVYSSSSSLAYREGTTTFNLLLKQLKFVIFGLTTLYICYRIPLGWWRFLSYVGMLLSIGLLLATIVFGKSINDAERWISIFGFSFQPAEFAKIATVLYLAKILESSTFETFKEFSLKVLAPLAIVCVLILVGSVSTAFVLAFISFVILIIAGVKGKYIFNTIIIALVTITFAIGINVAFGIFPRIDTATKRIERFFIHKEVSGALSAEEKQKEYDKTFQSDMARAAIASVGVLGKGPGNSTQRYVLPHPYSDFIYAIIIEEWGLFGAIGVLLLYLWFLYRCISLAASCTKIFTTIVVIGLALLITMQAMLHILVNVDLIPVTGHTLPLISLGGTSMVIMSGAFGIILSVSRTIEKDSQKDKPIEEAENEVQL